MEEATCTNYNRNKFWQNNVFPILPIITTKEADKHNTSSFSFHWLFFKFWTLDRIYFEVGITASHHWGLGFIFLLPFLRLAITIPLPYKWEEFVTKYLSRKPKSLM